MSPEHVVVGAALVREGRVLLCHRHPGREWFPGCWDLPGGHVEPGEDPDQAIVRACQEELGVTLLNVQPPPLDLDDPSIHMSGFVSDRWHGAVQNLAPREHDRIGWFTRDQLAALELAAPSYRGWLGGLLG